MADSSSITHPDDEQAADTWTLLGEPLPSRLLIGTALYPSPAIMAAAIRASGAGVVTVSLRRQQAGCGKGDDWWQTVRSLGCRLLPNTAGCHSRKEAVALAQMSRELFETHWIKLEVLGDDYNLQPDPIALVAAAEELLRDGFAVLPYCTDDLVVCKRLRDLGCEVIMPWGSPIGSGKGLLNPYALQVLRERLPEVQLIVDAGLGVPSHACQAMEMGFDGVLLNSAVALARDPVGMAGAFAAGVRAGRAAWVAGRMPERDSAAPSTPVVGMPFWHQESR